MPTEARPETRAAVVGTAPIAPIAPIAMVVLVAGALATFAAGELYLYFEHAKALWVAAAACVAWAAVALAGERLGARPAVCGPLMLFGAALVHLAAVTAAHEPRFDADFVLAKQALALALAVLVFGAARAGSASSFGRWLAYVLLAVGAIAWLGRGCGWDRSGLDFAGGDVSLTMGSSNYLACFLVVAFPIATAAAALEGPGPRRWTLWAAAFATYGLIALAGSRNGLVTGLVAGAAALFACRASAGRSSRRRALLLAVAFVAALLVLGRAVNPREAAKVAESVGKAAGAGDSVLDPGRRAFYAIARARIGESPTAFAFGHGAASFLPLANAFPAERAGVDVGRVMVLHAHSEPLEALVEGGALGASLVAAGALWLAVGLARAALDAARAREERAWAAAILCSLAGFAVFGLVDPAPRYVANLTLVAVLVGLGARLAFGRSARELGRGAGFAGLAVALACLAVVAPKLASDRLLSQAVAPREGTPADGARAELVASALRWNPRSLEARYESLQLAIAAGRADDAAREFTEIQRLAPFFLEDHRSYAYFLAGRGELARALELLHAYLDVHRYDLVARVQCAGLAVLVGDGERVTDELESILLVAVEKLRLGGATLEARIVDAAEGRTLEISGERTAAIRRDHLPWLLLRESPRSNADAERSIALHLQSFLADELKLGPVPFARELVGVYVDGVPRRWK